jgi:spore coat protein U-like protein
MKRALGLTILLAAAPAFAWAGCALSASGVAFGVYNPSSPAPTDAAGSVAMQCTGHDGDNGYVISLDPGGAGDPQRKMTASGDSLRYQLYLDAAHSQTWGDGNGGSSVISGSGNGRKTYSIYGRITARQAVSPGIYSDTPVATATF